MTANEKIQSHRNAAIKYNRGRGNIMIQPTLEEMDAIKSLAAEAGLSVRGYALQAVREKMSRDAAQDAE